LNTRGFRGVERKRFRTSTRGGEGGVCQNAGIGGKKKGIRGGAQLGKTALETNMQKRGNKKGN